jgi:Ran GTPase-activating protein (RanGAP) involved in mRNA processing and transport
MLIIAANTKSNASEIKYLNLSNSRFTYTGLSLFLKKLVENSVTSVRLLDLSDNKLKMKCMEDLSTFVSLNEELVKLNVSNLQINDSIFSAFTTTLSVSSITSLNLSKNKLSNSGILSLAKILENNCAIQDLDLSWNEVRAVGAKALILALRSNIKLIDLNLSWNAISASFVDKTFKNIGSVFSSCFEKNTSLRHLNLSYNHLTMEDCLEMSIGLRANHTLLGTIVIFPYEKANMAKMTLYLLSAH